MNDPDLNHEVIGIPVKRKRRRYRNVVDAGSPEGWSEWIEPEVPDCRAAALWLCSL